MRQNEKRDKLRLDETRRKKNRAEMRQGETN